MPKQKEKIDLLMKVFENLRTLISHADGKAGIALGLQSFIVTSILGASLISDTFKNLSVLDHDGRRFFYSLLASFFLTSVLCIAFCILVFMPRKPQEESEINRKGITYFGHIAAFKNSDAYLKAVEQADDDDLLKEFACQNYTLALILKHKMKYAKYSVNTLFISIFFGIILLFFSLIVR